MTGTAQYFDGDHPVAIPVTPHLSGAALELPIDADTTVYWPMDEIRQVRDGAGADVAVLRWTGDPLARLIVADPALLRHLPKLDRASPPKGRARLVAWALAAVAAVALQIGVLVPLLADNLARFIPPAGERALGEATLGHIREVLGETQRFPIPTCDRPKGRAALDRLTERLRDANGTPDAFSVLVLDHEMINAFALPGGFVVLFDGLIDAAQGPDEVAAVLAHEIGHVVSRDPTRHALRSAGSIGVLGLLLGDFAGGTVVLFLAEQLISARYSQAAETGADSFAHRALGQSNISPAALGTLFETMRKKHGESDALAAHFLSHPTLDARIAAARDAVDEDAAYVPSMSDEDWQALRKICG